MSRPRGRLSVHQEIVGRGGGLSLVHDLGEVEAILEAALKLALQGQQTPATTLEIERLLLSTRELIVAHVDHPGF